MEETTITFDFLVGENGFERDFLRDVQQCKIKQYRAKSPGGKVFVVNGAQTELTLDCPLDDAVKGSATIIGALEQQRESLVSVAA